MASGKPDWYVSAVLTGKYGIQFLPVAVDTDGNIKAVLQGSSLIIGDVNSTDQNTVKQIQGVDGGTYRTIAVDTLGQLISIMKSAAGNNVVVDASGFLSAILKGTYALPGDKNIAVDDAGRLIAQVKALYGSTVKDVQTDLNGNLTLNLKAQDLLELINREKQGAARISLIIKTVPVLTGYTVLELNGKGIVYGGWMYFIGVHVGETCPIVFYIDSQCVFSQEIDYLSYGNIVKNRQDFLYLTAYDANHGRVVLSFSQDIKFESYLKIYIQNQGNYGDMEVFGNFIYAIL